MRASAHSLGLRVGSCKLRFQPVGTGLTTKASHLQPAGTGLQPNASHLHPESLHFYHDPFLCPVHRLSTPPTVDVARLHTLRQLQLVVVHLLDLPPLPFFATTIRILAIRECFSFGTLTKFIGTFFCAVLIVTVVEFMLFCEV